MIGRRLTAACAPGRGRCHERRAPGPGWRALAHAVRLPY